MKNILSVPIERLKALGPDEAVDLLRDLLCAEASRQGIATQLVNVPTAIYAKDGGVDANLDIAEVPRQGALSKGITRFQVKSGDFNPTQNRQVEDLLCTDRKLKPRIESCFVRGGKLVIVLPGFDRPDQTDDALRNRFVAKIRAVAPQHETPTVEIWRFNQLARLLELHPPLALRAANREISPFRLYRSWATESEMNRPLQTAEAQQEIIAATRQRLRESDSPVHVRIVGDPGIGKTRLAFEAVSPEDLKSLVLYTARPGEVLQSPLIDILLEEEGTYDGLLIIDDCDLDEAAAIWNRLERSDRIRLVTISTDFERRSGNTIVQEIPELPKETIREILRSYMVPAEHLDRWGELCGGSPRVAHVIGQNLQTNPENLLSEPDTAQVWERYVVGPDRADNLEVTRRRTVLQHVALFKRFGFGRPVENEARAIHNLIVAVDPTITWPIFTATVQTLRQRHVIQGETTLYITPKAFHIWLWISWWEQYGAGFNTEALVTGLPHKLREWFAEMFRYAEASGFASRLVERLLGPDGPFADGTLLKTEDGARFFDQLAEADPRHALRSLETTLGTWSPEEIEGFTMGRRHVVWALEKILVWRDLFPGAARMLLRLAEGENESIGNNATGLFGDAFAPAPGRVSMTEAPPEERFPILKEALESPSPRKRSVALKACDRALYTGPFHRVVGAEYQGLRREPNLWTPQSGQEILSALERVWNLLVQRLRSEELSSAEQREIALVLLRNVRHLVNQDSLRLTVRETLEHLVRAKYIDKKEALQTVLDILHYDVKDEEERKAWQELREEFTGTSFDDRLRRFVGTRYITDQFSEAGQQEDQKEKAIQRLVDESLEERANLVRNLSWLVTPEAEDAFRFGRDLGVRDPELNLWPLILSAQKTTGSSFLFIGAYLNGASVTQRDRVEAILDQLAADPAARPWVVELVWRVGPLLPQSIDRVLELVATGTVPVSALGILAYGSVVNELPPEAMERLIHFLLVLATPESAQIALNIYHMYLLARKEVIDPVLATGILGSPAWFEAVPPNQRQPHTDYAWAELAQALAQKDPDAAGDLAATFLDSIEEEGALSLGYGPSRIMGFLTAQLARDPGRLWPVIRKRLGPPLDTASFHFRQWLSGERFWETTPGAIRHIPKEWIWQWIDEDVGSRAWYFASFVPKDLLDEGPSLARELLERFGDREDVRRNLMANYFTEGWTGPESAHRSALLDRVQAAIDREQHPVVRKWLFDYNEALKKRFEKATVEEEREW